MSSGEQRELLRSLFTRIDADEFADRVLDSYLSRSPGAPAEARRHAHMWVRWNLDLVVRWLLDGHPPTVAELEVLRARARQQALDGIPADQVPGNFRRAARFAWNAALEVADRDERVALLETADLLFAFVDRVSRIHAEAHAEAERVAPIAVDERLARGVLTRLVRDEPPTAEDVDFAGRSGFRLDGTFRPMVVSLPHAGGAQHLSLAGRLRAGGALAVSEGRWVVVLTWTHSGHAAPALPPGVTSAEGDLAARGQLEPMLDELRMLVDVALSHGHTGPVDVTRYLPELLLRSAPRVAARIRHQVYGPLRAQPDLGQTLDALVRHDFNRQRAAAALPVHRNTFRDRLTRIRDLNGLDLERSEDLGLAWLAYLCAPDPQGDASR